MEKADPMNPYVYEDEDNEIERNMVKSILRAFILNNGKYVMPVDKDRKAWKP